MCAGVRVWGAHRGCCRPPAAGPSGARGAQGAPRRAAARAGALSCSQCGCPAAAQPPHVSGIDAFWPHQAAPVLLLRSSGCAAEHTDVTQSCAGHMIVIPYLCCKAKRSMSIRGCGSMSIGGCGAVRSSCKTY